MDFLFATCCCPQPPRQRLQKLPGDGSIPLDQRTELPKGKPVADQVRRSGDRRRTGPAVDQSDLTEIVARAKGSELDALARNRGLSGVNEEESGAPRTLHDDRLALREAAFLEQASNLFRLPPIHAGEEFDALKRGCRIAPRRPGWWCLGVRLA